jgi:hypothetical protein
MMLRSMDARRRGSHARWLKSSFCFAFAQTRFPLGQVSYSEPGRIATKKTEKWTVFTETLC